MVDELESPQEDQQRQPEESVVQRWRRRQAKRSYSLYRITAKRRVAAKALLESISARRLALYGDAQSADAPAKKETRRYKRVSREL